MKPLNLLLGALLLAGGGWLAWRTLGPAPYTPVAAAAPASEITYICLETGALSRGPRVKTPALNPALGRETLVQALYCSSCQGWHRMPPAEVLERMPAGPVCPTSRTPLVETAPAGAPDEVAR